MADTQGEKSHRGHQPGSCISLKNKEPIKEQEEVPQAPPTTENPMLLGLPAHRYIEEEEARTSHKEDQEETTQHEESIEEEETAHEESIEEEEE